MNKTVRLSDEQWDAVLAALAIQDMNEGCEEGANPCGANRIILRIAGQLDKNPDSY